MSHIVFSPFISQLIARNYWIELRTICIKVIWYEIKIAGNAYGARHQLKIQTADQIRQERFLFELGRKKECLYLFTDRHLMRCCRIVCNMPCISRTSVNKGDFIIASRTLLINLKQSPRTPLGDPVASINVILDEFNIDFNFKHFLFVSPGMSPSGLTL